MWSWDRISLETHAGCGVDLILLYFTPFYCRFFFLKKEQILLDANLAYKWCWVWQGLNPNAIQGHQEALRYNNVTVGPRIPPLPPKADFTNSEPTYAQNFLPVTL